MGDNADAGSRSVTIRICGDALAHIILLGGVPAGGPLAFHGPFVMNPVEQIRFAEKAYVTGQMGMLAEIYSSSRLTIIYWNPNDPSKNSRLRR